MRLVLFMTRGMSLAAWEDNGSLERELALYAAFAQRGWTTTIVSWGGQRDKAIATRYPWLDVCVNQWGLSHAHYEYLMPVLHCRALWRADIIKSNQTNGADCAWRCARLWQKPFVARCGHMWSEFSRQQQHSDVQARAIECEVYTQCSRGIVTTKEARDSLVRAYGIDEQHVEIIYNYVTSTWYEAPLPPYHRPGSAVVTQVGRMAEQKNLPALIEACAGLPVTLRLVGDGPLREALRQHATTLGARVEFYGTVPSAELPLLLGESTVVTLVSHYEGQPRAMVEAMARGCAVLGTRVRGIEELIEDGVNGLLCSTDAPSIRAGLERLLADAALRERLGTQAREYAQRFRLETIAAQELRLYAQLPTQGGLRMTGPFLGIVTRAAAVFCRVLRRKSLELVKRKWEALLVQQLRHCLSHSDKVDCKSFFQKVLGNANESEKFALFTDIANAVGMAPHRLLLHLIKQHIDDKSPGDALAFLLDVDRRLHTLCDECAVACDNSSHTWHRHTHCHDFFVQRLDPGERVLDIGCGNGFWAWGMAGKAGACVSGTELRSRTDALVKISVIVPVYNDASCLPACLDSLLGQKEQRVEIICVDDCSTDNSLECLRIHADMDKRVRVLAQAVNQGSGVARNRGLQQARGEFVLFCDADDTAPPHALQRLLECAESNNVPVVCGNIAHMSRNMRLRVKGGVPASHIEKQDVVFPRKFPPLWLPWYHQRFLFRRSFLQKYGIKYPNLLRGQDPPMLARVLCTAKRVGVIPDTVYNYRAAIAPKPMSTRALDDYLTSIRLVMEIYTKHGCMHQARLYLLFCLRSFLPESTVQLYGRKIHQSIMEHFAKLADQYGTAGDFAPYLDGQATLDAFSLARKGVAAQKIHKFKHAVQRYFTKCRQA